MKRNLFLFAGVAAVVLGLGSCAYDPFHGGHSRSSASVGYGYGYGYGGSSFNTSYFWSTGDPRWGYDPYARSYYDFHRRAYYDPFLYGYYPVGYRPPILVGVPHPTGYRQGWCPPPRRVTNVTIVNYRNRESAYRNSSHSWARDVRYDSRHRSSTQDFRSRDSVRNTTRDRSQFINTSSTDTRAGWDGRRTSGGRTTNTSTWQNRTTEPQPTSFGTAVPSRQQFDRGVTGIRGTAGPQGSRPQVERGGRETRGDWSGRGGTSRQETSPLQQRGGGEWSGRQGQRDVSSTPRTGGGRSDGGRRTVESSGTTRGSWQNSTPQETTTTSGWGGGGRQGSNRGGRR
jgi:hypothetical protein